VRECRNTEPCLALEEVGERELGQMVHEAAGDHDAASAVLCRHPHFERITLFKAAGQTLLFGKPAGFGDEDRVEVDTDQFDIRAQDRGGRHRPHDETQPASHVDDAHRASATATHSFHDRGEQGSNAPSKLQLLAQPLQLTMHANAKGIDVTRIQNPAGSRNRRHDPRGAALA
jgi:hypothetical protein